MSDDDTGRCGDPNCTGYHPPRAVVEPAVSALHLARAGQVRPALRTVARLADALGPQGVGTACLIWAEIYIRAGVPTDVDRNQVDGIGFVNATDGVMTTDADSIEPGARWAGRFLLARVRRDYDQAAALLASVSDDPAQLTDGAVALMLSCAIGLGTPGSAIVSAEL